MIGTSTIKVKKSPGKCMYDVCVRFAILIVFLFSSYYERRSTHKNVVKKDREEIFIMCLHTHTHSSTHWDYDTVEVCVCAISDRTSDVAFDWAFDRSMTDGSHHYHQPFPTLLTMLALHKSSNRMKNDDDHRCPRLTFLQGEGNLRMHSYIYTLTYIYLSIRVDMKRNS